MNLTFRLEEATKNYGVTLIMSDVLHGVMSKRLQKQMRPIDRITLDKSMTQTSQTYQIYALDLDGDALQITTGKKATRPGEIYTGSVWTVWSTLDPAVTAGARTEVGRGGAA